MAKVKKPRGRPEKFKLDDQKLKQIESLAGYGLTVDKIADCFGICRKTFENHWKKNEEIYYAIKRGRAKAESNMSRAAYHQGINGNTSMAIFWLKTRAGWKETQVVEEKITVKDNDKSVESMTDEELEREYFERIR